MMGLSTFALAGCSQMVSLGVTQSIPQITETEHMGGAGSVIAGFGDEKGTGGLALQLRAGGDIQDLGLGSGIQMNVYSLSDNTDLFMASSLYLIQGGSYRDNGSAAMSAGLGGGIEFDSERQSSFLFGVDVSGTLTFSEGASAPGQLFFFIGFRSYEDDDWPFG